MSLPKKKKAVILTTSGLLALALLVGGVTTAVWSDNVGLDGAQITAGNLDIEKIGDVSWTENSFDSPNFGGDISLADYRITPGDSIQGRQDLDVALDGDNIRANFSVHTDQLVGDLYSPLNGVSGNFMVIDENGFTVMPATPLGDISQETILAPSDVSAVVDGNKDYTFIVNIAFDEDTPDQVRTQVSADLKSIDFNLNQTRDNLDSPLTGGDVQYALSATTTAEDNYVESGATARFTHVISNSGTAPINNIEVRSPFGTSDVATSLAAGSSVRVSTDVPNVTADINPTFEFYGETDAGLVKLQETTKEVRIEEYSATILRTSSSTLNQSSGIVSVDISHEITNNSTHAVSNVVVEADGYPDSNIHPTLQPGETATLHTHISPADWSGGKDIEFTVQGTDPDSQLRTLSQSTTTILAVEAPSSILTNIRTYGAGYGHTCEIRDGGQVWCKGANSRGQLGNDSTDPSNTFVRAEGVTKAVNIDSGLYHNFVITSEGKAWAWGDNDQGQLGLPDRGYYSTPQELPLSNVKTISSHGSSHSAIALFNDGTIKVAGSNDYVGADVDASKGFVDPSMTFSNVKDVSVGFQVAYVVNGDGTVWGIGNSAKNALNDGGSTPLGQWVRIGTHSDVKGVQAFDKGGMYERDGGEIYGWGWGEKGQFGNGSTADTYLTRLPHYEEAKKIDVGWSSLVMLKEDGTLWANGWGEYGTLGLGGTNDVNVPTQITTINNASSIALGNAGASAVTDGGTYVWGDVGTGHINSPTPLT